MFHCPVEVRVIEQHAIIVSDTARFPIPLWIEYLLFSSGLGRYMHMLETNKRQGFMAVVEFPYLLLNGSCLELFYYFMGNTVTTLSVQTVTEDFKVRLKS